MDKFIKINGDIFYIKELVIQLSTMIHATIDIFFDLKKYPNYSNVFFSKYEKNEKFTIIGTDFEAIDTFIKRLDVDYNTGILNISVKSDVLKHKDISDRREEKIEDLLNNKEDKNSINSIN